MNAIRRHPLFTAWILLCAILLIGGLGWTYHLRQRVRHELSSLAQKNRQKEQLLVQPKLSRPDAANEPIARTAPTATPHDEAIPARPLDSFIEIASAKDALRRLAADQEVALRADESFGFASYASEGPRESQLVPVHRQLGMVKTVVEALFAARPAKLIAVQREQPQPSLVGQDDAQPTAPDFFRLDPRLDLRVAGLIDGRSARVEFSGTTHVLRTFLDSLASMPEPFLVRSVEAEPQPSGSKFSVVVELVEPVASSGGEMIAVMAGSPAAASLWTVPPVVSIGANQACELFGPQETKRGSMPALVQSGSMDEVELQAVKREPYRLQLVGYFGAPGKYTATFISPGSPEIFFARIGHRFESLDLTLKELEVASPAGVSGGELTFSALVWDGRKQATVTLVGRERLLTNTPVAILRLAPLPAKPREFRIGDVFQDGTTFWRIERIQLEPAEVAITRQSAGETLSEQKVLRPIIARVEPTNTEVAVADRRK